MKDLIKSIQISDVAEAEEILKSAGSEDLFEKARQVGDMHPNGKWVWTEYAPGKFDWRGIKKKNGGSGKTAKTAAKPVTKSSVTGAKKDEKEKVISPTDSEICAMSFDEAKKLGKVDVSAVNTYKFPMTLKWCKRDLESLRGNKLGWGGELSSLAYNLNGVLKTDVGRRFKSDAEKAKKIQEISNELATKKEIEKRIVRIQSDLNKKKKQFLSDTEEDFTEKEVRRWLDEFNTAEEPAAIVNNRWKYFAGKIGSTTASIQVGKGKEKPFTGSRWDNPNWRPIGMLEYSIPNWNHTELISVKIPIQSWDDVQKNLDETEDFTLYLYKHPKQ